MPLLDVQGLLRADEPDAVEVFNPKGRSEFVLLCDHASNRVPVELKQLGLTATELQGHIAWDVGAAQVARRLAELLDARLVLSGYSRLVIDCNRPLVSPQSITPVSDGVVVQGNVGLTEAERAQRIDLFFEPYHHVIRQTLDARSSQTTQLLSIHSFSPALVQEGADTLRPWHVGMSFKDKPMLSDRLYQALHKNEQLCVGYHEPYAIDEEFDYTLIEHGLKRQLEHAMVEIRQDQLMSESQTHQWAQRLFEALR